MPFWAAIVLAGAIGIAIGIFIGGVTAMLIVGRSLWG
jgi:hypothetical protein